jgi:hypothetical protein
MKTIYFAYNKLFKSDHYDPDRYYNLKEYDAEQNRFGMEPHYIKETVQNLGYNIENIRLKYAIKQNLNFFYEIGTMGSPENWFGFKETVYDNFQNTNKYVNLFDLLDHKLIKKIQERKCFLTINLPLEGFAFVNPTRSRDLYSCIYKTLSEKNIPANQILITTSNIKENIIHDQWCKQNKVTEKLIISPNYFFAHSAKEDINHILLEDHISYKTKNNIKLYSNLNRIVRDHRVLLGIMLNYKNLIELGHMSHDYIDMEYLNNLYYIMRKYNNSELNCINSKTFEDFRAKLPLITDITDFTINQAPNFFTETYLKTWVSLITETYFFEYPNESIFYSEKTFKPIRARHPFILVAPAGYLNNLKTMGFKTFDRWWDESYDLESNPISRLQKIVELVESLSKKSNKEWFEIYSEIQDTLEHNVNNLKNNNWTDHLTETVKNIMEKM